MVEIGRKSSWILAVLARSINGWTKDFGIYSVFGHSKYYQSIILSRTIYTPFLLIFDGFDYSDGVIIQDKLLKSDFSANHCVASELIMALQRISSVKNFR